MPKCSQVFCTLFRQVANYMTLPPNQPPCLEPITTFHHTQHGISPNYNFPFTISQVPIPPGTTVTIQCFSILPGSVKTWWRKDDHLAISETTRGILRNLMSQGKLESPSTPSPSGRLSDISMECYTVRVNFLHLSVLIGVQVKILPFLPRGGGS